MKKIILLCFALFSAIAFANEGKSALKGHVSDENGLPLPGAEVYIESIGAGTATDFDGNFTMLGLPAGKYEVKVAYLGYKTVTQEVELTDNQTKELKFKLSPDTNTLQEVVIKSSARESQARALNKQKNNDNITNVVAADQMGKFPDSNIGDALKRIPGITMQNDQGEARDIIVRGLAPQLNSVTLNGERIPSAEGDNRRVQMDLIPTDMIQVVEVNKAVTPDMEADAIGGSVNLVTRAASSKLRISATGAYGGNPIRNGSLYNFSATVGNRFANDKIGVVVSASLNSNDYGSDNVEFEWDKSGFLKEHDIRKYDVRRIRQSISANLDFKLSDNNTIFFKTIFSKRDDRENRFRLRYKFDDDDNEYKITRQTKGGIDNSSNKNRRLERQKTNKISLGGEHILFNSVKLTWKGNMSNASEERPNERYMTYEFKEDGDKIVQRDLNTQTPYFENASGSVNTPSNFEVDEISEQRRFTKEKNFGFRIDLKIPINATGDYKNSIKVGYKLKDKEKLRDNIFYNYTDDFDQYKNMSSVTTSSQTRSNFLAGSQYQSGLFATNSFLGGLNFTPTEEKLDFGEFVPKNYNADEVVNAFYTMLKQKLGKKVSMIAGFRIENTSIDYQGYKIDVKTAKTLEDKEVKKGKKSYANFLPNVQFKFTPSKNTVVRLAYTNAIARPNYYDLVPYESIDSKKEEVEYGNPDLKAATAMNLDLMAERYFSNVGILSGGVFYKDIDNFIYEARDKENLDFGNGVVEYETKRIFNGGNAKVYGFEVAFQRQLNFLPSFLKNLNLYANYTYTGSKTKGIGGREDGLAFAGAVKNMVNTSLSYDTKKLTLRTSLNYAGDYIDEYGDEAIEDRYYDSQLFLDFNGSYAINKNFRVFAEVKNITNQPLRFYQGTKNRTMQAEYYDLNWNIGLKYNF